MSMEPGKYLSSLSLLALACGGHAVDLGHDDQGWSDVPEPSSADSADVVPQTIYQADQRVLSFTIDETTLYALVAHTDSFELVSCPIEACRSQRTTLYRGPALVYQANYSAALMVVAGSLVWLMDDRSVESHHHIASCPTSGCEELVLVSASAQALAADQEHVYWIDAQRYVMRLAPGASEPELVRDLNPELYALQPRAAVGDDAFYYNQNQEFYAVRKDGTSGPQLVVKDRHIADFAASGAELFYSTRLLTGRINRCQAAACTDTRQAIAKSQSWPLEVHVANDEAFWLNQLPVLADKNHASLASCVLPGCENVRQWGIEFETNHYSPLQTPFSFALNRRYVVWVERFRDLGSGLRRVSR
jgi:hypothetical protein